MLGKAGLIEEIDILEDVKNGDFASSLSQKGPVLTHQSSVIVSPWVLLPPVMVTTVSLFAAHTCHIGLPNGVSGVKIAEV